MIDPKEPSSLRTYKVYINDWYGDYGLLIEAESKQEAAFNAVKNAMAHDACILDAVMFVDVERDTITSFQAIPGEAGDFNIETVED